MTSVASFGSGTTAGNYTLIFSGTTVGNFVESFVSGFERKTAVEVRHNYWSTTVVLDGKYPALVWEHEFLLYTESASLTIENYIDTYFDISDLVTENPQALAINDGDTENAIITFGNCYFVGADQQTPKELLKQKAGLLQVRFIGNTKPVLP